MTEYGTVIDKRNLATAQSVSNLNGRVSNLSKTTDDVKDIAESALKVATIEYAIGTETEATGEWQALTPKPNAGEYVWQRVTVTTGAGKTTQTTALIQNIAALAQSTAETAKEKADTATASAKAAQSTADTAVSNAATAQTKADEAASAAATAQGKADSAGEAAASAQAAAEAAQTAAGTAQTTADSASSAASSAQSAASKAQKTADTATTNAAAAQSTADTAKADAATAQTTADTAVSNAATAQSTADTAKENAAAAQTGVDTLNTYIRSRDDGVEVARKDADGNYVGYKTIQTAGGLEVRTADDVVVAKYGKSVKIGENATSQVTIDSQTLQIITKLYKLYALSVKTRYIDTSTDVPVEFDKLEGGTVPFASSISFSVSVDPAVGEYYPLADFIIHASDGRYHAVMGVQSGISKTETCTAQKEVDDIGGGTVSGSLTFTAVYDGAKTFTLSNFSTSDIESVEWHVSYTVLSTEVPEVRIQGDSYISGRLGVSSRGETVDMSDGDVTLTGKVDASEGINTDGAITIKYKDIKEMFSGIISVGYEDKDLNLSAGGNTGDAIISLSKDGYSARCICGWNLSGTGASNCTIARIYVNQTDQQAHYYVKNTGSSKATPTLRIYILYTKKN